MKRGERDVGSGSVLAGAFKGNRCIGHDDEGLNVHATLLGSPLIKGGRTDDHVSAKIRHPNASLHALHRV